ncbi:MAG: HAD family phosphatase [Fretibacterium sp.]|nr:HAD family phosphatase [Fretibacterium sp.]
MIDAVIFDMDGVMFDTETLNMRAWMEAGTLHGYVVTEEMVHAHIGANVQFTRNLMEKHFGPEFDFDAVRADRIRIAFEDIKENGMPVKPGLVELLDWLRGRGFRTAMATSSERRFVDFYLERSGIRHPFDVIVTGDMVTRSKPEPDIFLKAAEELRTEPVRCMVLEDSYNGIRAARAAGTVPVMIPDLLPPTLEMERLFHVKLDSLKEVAPLIEALNSEGGGAS